MSTADAELSDTSYESFSLQPEYVELNKLFVESLPLSEVGRVLDLACGTGTMSELLMQRIRSQAKSSGRGKPTKRISIVGMDISETSLQHAKRRQALEALPDGDRPGDVREPTTIAYLVGVIRASADRLPLASATVDAVVIGNAIQLFDDKDGVVHETQRVLRSGGLLAFNTSFYAGTYESGTERFYVRWMEEAVAYLKQKDAELRQRGLPGIRRRKGLVPRAFSRPWLSRTEFERLLTGNGFDVRSVRERTVQLSQRNLEAIGSYQGLAEVLLSGYPTQLACEALEKSVAPALTSIDAELIQRNWIEVVGTKR